MNASLALSTLIALTASALPLHAYENASDAIDQKYDKITGFDGVYYPAENVYRIEVPRTDVKVTNNQFPIDPSMGLTSWIAFTRYDPNRFLVNGDLVVFEDEINPVIATLLESRIEVTALNRRFLNDNPRVYFLHFEDTGSIVVLSEALRKVFDQIKRIRDVNAAPQTNLGRKLPENSQVDASYIEGLLGREGTLKDGRLKILFGRKVYTDGIQIGKMMGVGSWTVFAGNEQDGVVYGAIAALDSELPAVLKALVKGNFQISAIENQELSESPGTIYVYFWGEGKIKEIAQTFKDGLKQTQ